MANEKFYGNVKRAEGAVESKYGEMTGDAGTEFAGKAKRALGSVEHALGSTQEYVQDTYSTVSKQVNAKPMQSALIAMGIGFLLSRLV